MALAFVSEHLTTVVRTPEEVGRRTGLGLLAIVPRTRAKLAGAGPGATAAAPWLPGPDLEEAYRTLRSSVLLGWDESMRRLLVTSPQPRDGKTTICLHLAWSLAQLGRRVLLIDADMRKPNCARQLGLDHPHGLSEYLEGRAERDQIMVATSVENLWCVPAGRPHAGASDLLYSPRLAALLYETGAGFDHVIIDSPPSLALSDARTIARLVEGVLLVVSDTTERSSLERTKQAFDDARVRFLGFVMNRVNLNNLDYGNYREYGYQYYHK
jgi:capsular exopolysaccharide synthesis family protein